MSWAYYSTFQRPQNFEKLWFYNLNGWWVVCVKWFLIGIFMNKNITGKSKWKWNPLMIHGDIMEFYLDVYWIDFGTLVFKHRNNSCCDLWKKSHWYAKLKRIPSLYLAYCQKQMRNWSHPHGIASYWISPNLFYLIVFFDAWFAMQFRNPVVARLMNCNCMQHMHLCPLKDIIVAFKRNWNLIWFKWIYWIPTKLPLDHGWYFIRSPIWWNTYVLISWRKYVMKYNFVMISYGLTRWMWRLPGRCLTWQFRLVVCNCWTEAFHEILVL